MKRRRFLQSALALAAAPALPLPSAAAPALPPQLVLLSEHHAARHGTVSAALFARRMGVPLRTAEALSARLVEKGLAVVAKPITPKAYAPDLGSEIGARAQKLARNIKRPPPDGEGQEQSADASVDLGEQTVERRLGVSVEHPRVLLEEERVLDT